MDLLVPIPGNLPFLKKKMLMPGGWPRGRWAPLELTDALSSSHVPTPHYSKGFLMGRSIFYPNPPKDGKFLHKGCRILNQRSKGAAKTLRGRNPAILSGGADKKWNDPIQKSAIMAKSENSKI